MARAGPRRTTSTARSRNPADARQALIDAAISGLREVGFVGASAREIAGRAGRAQALIFYHFGSVVDLLLAALDHVSTLRLERYRAAVDAARSLSELVEAARRIYVEDLEQGYVTVLAEMIAGAQATPGLREQVAARMAPWKDFAAAAIGRVLADSPVPLLWPVEELAHGAVALYLGLEMLANLDGDGAAGLALFDRAASLASLLELFLASQDAEAAETSPGAEGAEPSPDAEGAETSPDVEDVETGSDPEGGGTR